ncbi:MAG: protein kinase [Myxococcales bacterium]|nr:protein kinase [Myxococcales bacterium]
MPAARPPALRILFITANPSTTERIRFDAEVKEIDRKIRDSPHREGIVVDACWAASADDLQRALLERAPHVIHFSGHGLPHGVILESSHNGRGLATPEALAGILRVINRDVVRVRTVLLNACHSAAQLDLLSEVVDCAIGMNASVRDEVAVAFAAAFYQAVGSGRSLQEAFVLARTRLQIDWPEYAHSPQIRARGGVRLADLHLLPPPGSRLEAPMAVDTSGRWLTGQNLKAGDHLAEGRFLLEEWLGQGTFATVWRARESASGREVALKILHERYAGDLVIHDRFFRGARLMSQFRHPAIVEVLDACVVWHGYRFFVMDYVRGRTLLDYALEHTLSWRAIVTYGLEIGSALVYAHERQCIHRDIKPANILIDGHGHAKLIDFDLVRDLYVEGGTRPGAMGTVAYAAPEALDRPQDADGRSDEYSLALTMAAAIAGHEPTRHDKRDPLAFIAGLRCPRELRDVLRRATSWEPHDRYGSMLGFCAALQESVRHVDAAQRRRQTVVRSTWMACGGLGLVLVAGYGVWTSTGAAPTAPTRPTTSLNVVAPDVNTPAARVASPGLEDPLPAVLRTDHSRARYAIRVSADDRPQDAEANARKVLLTSEHRPWIVRDQFTTRGKYLIRVLVGDYPDRSSADIDRLKVRTILGEGAQVVELSAVCPVFRYNPAGYHECDDPAQH